TVFGRVMKDLNVGLGPLNNTLERSGTVKTGRVVVALLDLTELEQGVDYDEPEALFDDLLLQPLECPGLTCNRRGSGHDQVVIALVPPQALECFVAFLLRTRLEV